MTFWEITRKDLILLVRDARALALLVAFPMLFIVIIGATTGQLLGWKDENQILKIGVVDRIDYAAITDEFDRQQARNITAKIINRIAAGEGRRMRVLEADEDYRALLVDDKLNAVFLIDRDFIRRVDELSPEDVSSDSSESTADRLRRLNLEIHTDMPKGSSTKSTIEELLYYNVIETIAPYVFCNKIRTNNIAVNAQIQARLNCGQLRDEEVAIVDPASDADAAVPDGESRVYQELIPSYTVMFVFFLVNIMSRSFLHERDLGTMRRLRLAPVSTASLVAGKTVPFFLISLVQSVLLFICGRLLFGMSWGANPLMLLPVIFTTSLAATGLGLVVATLVRSESQVSAYANIIVISMAGISGCFMPRDWLPEKLRTFSLATPHAWSLISYEQLLKREVPDLSIVWQNCGVLVLFAIAYFVFGCLRFRHIS